MSWDPDPVCRNHRRLWADEQPPLVTLTQLLGLYLRRHYNNVHYAKAQNLRKVLTEQINAALDRADVLVVPSTLTKALKLRQKRTMKASDWLKEDLVTIQNTTPTDLTGHPSLVMPCAVGEHDRPISIMFTGKHWQERTVFRVSYAYENMIPEIYRQLDVRGKAVMAGLV